MHRNDTISTVRLRQQTTCNASSRVSLQIPELLNANCCVHCERELDAERERFRDDQATERPVASSALISEHTELITTDLVDDIIICRLCLVQRASCEGSSREFVTYSHDSNKTAAMVYSASSQRMWRQSAPSAAAMEHSSAVYDTLSGRSVRESRDVSEGLRHPIDRVKSFDCGSPPCEPHALECGQHLRPGPLRRPRP